MKKTCSNCNGRGNVSCGKCDGKGRYEDGFESFGRGLTEFVTFKNIKPKLYKCGNCFGRGNHKCPDCYGKGFVNS